MAWKLQLLLYMKGMEGLGGIHIVAVFWEALPATGSTKRDSVKSLFPGDNQACGGESLSNVAK